MAPSHDAIALDREEFVSAAGRGEIDAAMSSPNALVPAARAGDERAFQGLVEAYWGQAARLAGSIMRSEEAAADAVQEALIKVHQAMPRFKDGNFRGWLMRIVTNTCYDHLRGQKRQDAVSLDRLLEESELETPDRRIEHDPVGRALRRERLEVLSGMVKRLPAWYRDVVILVDIHGCDYAEAAEILELPRGTVKSRLSRARASLRDRLLATDLLDQPRD